MELSSELSKHLNILISNKLIRFSETEIRKIKKERRRRMEVQGVLVIIATGGSALGAYLSWRHNWLMSSLVWNTVALLWLILFLILKWGT